MSVLRKEKEAVIFWESSVYFWNIMSVLISEKVGDKGYCGTLRITGYMS